MSPGKKGLNFLFFIPFTSPSKAQTVIAFGENDEY